MYAGKPISTPLWPAVPAIMPGEAFGSWFGRIAARYRIDVDELARAAHIELDLGPQACRWLVTPAPQGQSAVRLARLSGVPIHDFEDLGRGCATKRFRYCFKCLVLNPRDVFAPYWSKQWLRADWQTCERHPQDNDALSEQGLEGHKNMYKLLKLVGRRRRLREERMGTKMWPMPRASRVR